MSRFEDRHRRSAARHHTVPDSRPTRAVSVSVGIIADLTPSTPEQLDLARRLIPRYARTPEELTDFLDAIGVTP